MKTGFTNYTYEVMTCTADKWVLDTIFQVKWRAIEYAEQLALQNKFSAVKVTAEPESGSGPAQTIFEQKAGPKAKSELTISRVDHAPPCEILHDYYDYPARKTIGRLLRKFINTRSLSALELMFDYGNLLSIERHDTLLMRAVQRITSLQTDKTDLDPTKINNRHYNAFEKIIRKAKVLDMDRRRYNLLQEKGVDALLDDLAKAEGKDDPHIGLYHTLSLVMNECTNTDQSLQALIALFYQTENTDFRVTIDGIIAELMDNSENIADLLQERTENGKICHFLIKLSRGDIDCNPKTPAGLISLNDALRDDLLPTTKELMVEKVRLLLQSINSLIKSSDAENRDSFATIVRSLKERTGFIGGPKMSAAITLRAKITLKKGPDDLSIKESIEAILSLVPDPAIRLGYVLDLSQSDLKKKYLAPILDVLVRMESKLHSISSLIPDLSQPRDSFCVLSGILYRLNDGDYPTEFKERLEEKVVQYLKILEDSIKTGQPIIDTNQPVLEEGTEDPTTDQPEKDKAIKKDGKSLTIKAGTQIFKEGDEADCAYIIKSGSVEISKMIKGNKVTLITLGSNQIFGELALLENNPRSADATALKDCRLTRVTKKALDSQIDGLNGFIKYWLLHLSDRVLDLTDRIEK